MDEETGPDGRLMCTVAQIAAEFGVTRPTIYRHLAGLPAATPSGLTVQNTGRRARRSADWRC